MLKQNTYPKIMDVNNYLKFPYEGFHSSLLKHQAHKMVKNHFVFDHFVELALKGLRMFQ